MADAGQFMLFTLILMRMSGFVLLNPILGRSNIPGIVRAGLMIVLTVIVFSYAGGTAEETKTALEYGALLLKEFFVGYALGVVVSLFMYVVLFAGEFMDNQMGISMAKTYDPQSNSSISMSSTLYNTMFMMLFFAVNGHLALIRILLTSAEIVPYSGITVGPELSTHILAVFCECTVLAVKFAFPVFAGEFICEIGMGILMKTIPQINVFVVNIQLKIVIGLLILLIMLSPMSEFLQELITAMIDTMKGTLRLL